MPPALESTECFTRARLRSILLDLDRVLLLQPDSPGQKPPGQRRRQQRRCRVTDVSALARRRGKVDAHRAMSLTGAPARKKKRRVLLGFFGLFLLAGAGGAVAVLRAPVEILLRGERPPLQLFLTALIPAVFALIGIAGLRWASRMGREDDRPVGRGLAMEVAPGRRGRAVVEVDDHRAMSLTGALGALARMKRTDLRGLLAFLIPFSLLWNGFVMSTFVQKVRDYRAGDPSWELLVLLLLVLAGLGLVLAVVYVLLVLSNPRPQVALTPGAVPLGGSVRIEWQLEGKADWIDTLTVTLEGREEAQYEAGSSTATASSTFVRVPVARADRLMGLRLGSAMVRVPEDAMHSFDADNNKVLWMVKIHGEIRRWPNLDEEFPLEVLPLGAPA